MQQSTKLLKLNLSSSRQVVKKKKRGLINEDIDIFFRQVKTISQKKIQQEKSLKFQNRHTGNMHNCQNYNWAINHRKTQADS